MVFLRIEQTTFPINKTPEPIEIERSVYFKVFDKFEILMRSVYFIEFLNKYFKAFSL